MKTTNRIGRLFARNTRPESHRRRSLAMESMENRMVMTAAMPADAPDVESEQLEVATYQADTTTDATSKENELDQMTPSPTPLDALDFADSFTIAGVNDNSISLEDSSVVAKQAIATDAIDEVLAKYESEQQQIIAQVGTQVDGDASKDYEIGYALYYGTEDADSDVDGADFLAWQRGPTVGN
jgi:hypothetical protein